jgi:hypothetical protein
VSADICLGEQELFDHVRHRSTDQSEVDPLGPGEPHRFYGAGHQTTAQRGAVQREHHVGAAFQHLHLVAQRLRWPRVDVRLGQQVEDQLARCADIKQPWAERSQLPPDAEINRHRTGDQPHVRRRRELARCADVGPRRCGLSWPRTSMAPR